MSAPTPYLPISSYTERHERLFWLRERLGLYEWPSTAAEELLVAVLRPLTWALSWLPLADPRPPIVQQQLGSYARARDSDVDGLAPRMGSQIAASRG